jgi:murein L,D-transpeptidase YcbB/YkuD
MENFKFILFSIFILALLGFAGYWAFTTIESGSSHVNIQKQKELEKTNEELNKEMIQLKNELSLLQIDKEQQIQKEKEALFLKDSIPETTKTVTPIKTAVYKYQSLINELQKLIDGNIYLKLKSQGLAVGTIQKFLNTYNKTSNKVDNDYGASTVTAVKNFQKAQGLTSDGETGPNTYKKMISWLKTK